MKKYWLQLVIGVVSVVLLVCNIMRMIYVDVTYDESSTYLEYISNSYSNIFHNIPTTANNHFLNSFLAKLFIRLFGDTLFVIHMPGLLALVLYLLFSYMLAKKLFNDKLWVLSCFLLLQFNPFLFEFMGLSRGYGLAIAMMTASIYYLITYLQESKNSMLFCSMIFVVLAVYANLSILNYAAAWVAVVGIHQLRIRNRRSFVSATAIIMLTSITIYLLLGKQIADLRASKQLYYGGTSDFIHDTLASLVRESMYIDPSNRIVYYIAVVLVVLVFLASRYWIVKWLKKKEADINGIALGMLFIIPALATVAQHYLFKTPYLVERTALFFYPLLILALLYTLCHIISQRENYMRWQPATLVLLFLFNFAGNLNFSSARSWTFDRHTGWLLERMVSEKKSDDKIKVYLEWLISGSFRYTIKKEYPEKFEQLETWEHNLYNDTEYDYYLVYQHDAGIVPDAYIQDTVFHNNLVCLYKKKH